MVVVAAVPAVIVRCLLHELDHLNGITFLDHLSALKRQLAEKKLKKYQRIAL